ncbi:DUF4845 domain-containing protein [Methylococcus geothermalis]|uniref:DUF4845 domain-containing protein n=1 Tax=Methylococcus geothermalis TaxID=2681310 RepID=A0A858Q8M4_9GAMM|nr:DUF4845 domain-containing protein [Methylococcus geothermalis]QJD30151.1 DUF4845 domain-containing protein [Methylococcus geothermalis]
MRGTPQRLRGLTFISFAVLMAVAGFFMMLLFRIGPVYLNHYKVRSSLESLKSDPELLEKTREDILKALERRWDINMVDGVTTKDVKITRSEGVLRVQIAYEVVKPVMGNIDALIRFDDRIEVARH